MPKHSAGLLLFRRAESGWQVLLAHPGGPFWARKDKGAWSIPKGELAEDEDPLQGALREFAEETGHHVTGEFIALDPLRQPGGKLVSAWAVEADFDPARLRSNTFSMEWPPRSGRQASFPEIDRAAWFGLDEARSRILLGQVGFLDAIAARLADRDRRQP
ncbi:MAG TPA: NUDIX domain-containing protein [Vicinamibacterales bacterium]|jgi:predicted NUDIX family NTP pyrophosphohydrolase|nr:NUDIX domain-containing protein [Vicinamibacterales bacterium]